MLNITSCNPDKNRQNEVKKLLYQPYVLVSVLCVFLRPMCLSFPYTEQKVSTVYIISIVTTVFAHELVKAITKPKYLVILGIKISTGYVLPPDS